MAAAGPGDDGSSGGSGVVERYYEHQRHFPLVGWSTALLPSDRWPLTLDEAGKQRLLSIAAYPLPEHYTWLDLLPPSSPVAAAAAGAPPGGAAVVAPAAAAGVSTAIKGWRPEVVAGQTDRDGWQYALDFPRQWYPQCGKMHHVRRRCWMRTRVLIPSSGRPLFTDTPSASSSSSSSAGSGAVAGSTSVNSSVASSASASASGDALAEAILLRSATEPLFEPGEVAAIAAISSTASLLATSTSTSATSTSAPASASVPYFTASFKVMGPSSSPLSSPTSGSSAAAMSPRSAVVQHAPVRVSVFQNERYYPGIGWSAKLLPTDRWAWSDEGGTRRLTKEMAEEERVLEERADSKTGAAVAAETATATAAAAAPGGATDVQGVQARLRAAAAAQDPVAAAGGQWVWASEWSPMRHQQRTDTDGWCYAVDFPAAEYHRESWKGAFVRRRLWGRKRVWQPYDAATAAPLSPAAAAK